MKLWVGQRRTLELGGRNIIFLRVGMHLTATEIGQVRVERYCVSETQEMDDMAMR